jgi:hypothetical protein
MLLIKDSTQKIRSVSPNYKKQRLSFATKKRSYPQSGVFIPIKILKEFHKQPYDSFYE